MMHFDFDNIQLATLMGFFEDAQGQNARHIQIPVTPEVQCELKSMLAKTNAKLGLPANAKQIPTFDPAEKYSAEDPVQLSLSTEYVSDLKQVTELQNLPSSINALNSVSELVYYYVIFTDHHNKKLYAFRRANHFKGISKSVLTYVNGGLLTLMNSAAFRLDPDFDYLVADQSIFILRPSGFEFTTKAHEQILQAATTNADAIAASIPFIDMSRISHYATKHARSARLLAAIRSRNDLHLIDQTLLSGACLQYGIQTSKNQHGAISPDKGHEYDFLCILDRRAYTTTLIPNQQEKYEASSRIQK